MKWLILAASVGYLFVFALCAAAKRGDEHLEEYHRKRESDPRRNGAGRG